MTQEVKQMKYDVDKIEDVLSAGAEWAEAANNFGGPRSALGEKLLKALEALRPKPDMEYVLPEWSEFSKNYEPVYTPIYDPSDKHVNTGAAIVFRSAYNTIREVTRIPAKPKAIHTKDMVAEDQSSLAEAMRQVAINSKQSGQ